MTPITFPAWLTAVLLWATLLAPAHATIRPPSHIAAEMPHARLAGQGAFRWFGLKLYDAQLWTGPEGYRTETSKFALDLRYARDLQGARIAKASHDEIAKLGFGSPDERAAWLARMEKLFPDVRDGTHITGIYLPGDGARFYLDGKPLGEVRDAAFGKAFFAIWMDARTAAPSLRAALLDNATPPR